MRRPVEGNVRYAVKIFSQARPTQKGGDIFVNVVQLVALVMESRAEGC
jgi:hypothetical protein